MSSWKRFDSFLKIFFVKTREISWIEIYIVSPDFVAENIIDGECLDIDNLTIRFYQRHCVDSAIGCSVICGVSSYTRDRVCSLLIWQIILLCEDTGDKSQL